MRENDASSLRVVTFVFPALRNPCIQRRMSAPASACSGRPYSGKLGRSLWALVFASFSTSACYTYSYQERNGPDLARIAIDRNAPTSEVRWTYLWGVLEDTWAPTGCAEKDPQGNCIRQIPLCDEGAGQVTSGMVWYSVPVLLLTVGLVLPMKLEVDCATGRASDSPPPVGP